MIKKRETCLYCGEKMESKTAKKKFCSPLHKLYWHREFERGTLEDHQLEAKKGNPKSGDTRKDDKPASKQNEAERKKILDEIEAIRKEVIPKERDTFYGRKSWKVDQVKKITELESRL